MHEAAVLDLKRNFFVGRSRVKPASQFVLQQLLGRGRVQRVKARLPYERVRDNTKPLIMER